MKRLKTAEFLSALLISLAQTGVASGAPATPGDSIIVDQKGGGQYRTITAALAALPDFAYQRAVIFIRNGVYNEKIRLTQNYVTLRGESRDSTIIRYNQKRTDWEANKDFIGPGVVNIHADDIVLENLTVENSQPEIEPHAFAVYGKGTRTILRNCNLLGYGGDTVSLWDYQQEMYYHANCLFRGAVDMVCPRGWCFIRDSQFYEVKTSAAIWHDGHNDPDQKFVIRNSSFDGVPGFQLGRHHYDAQFYLIDCTFSASMADQPIYLKTYEDASRNNPFLWGDQKYFYHCCKAGQAFNWVRDNLAEASNVPAPEEITPAWTFAGRWNPEETKPIAVGAYIIDRNQVLLSFDECVTVRGKPIFTNKSDFKFEIVQQRFTDNQWLAFISDRAISKNDLQGEMTLADGEIIASVAYVNERRLEKHFSIPENPLKK